MIVIAGTHETPEGMTIADWFGQKVGKPQYGPYAALGWCSENEIVTAALFNDANGANLELHLVGPLSRQVMRDIGNYTFNVQKVCRLTAKPYRSSKKLRAALIEVGFQYEGVMKRYYGPQKSCDAIVYRLDRHAAEKWMA